MSAGKPRVSVFFPAYNEEANIAQLTEEAVRTLRELCGELEVIIVNDGSADRTGEIAEELARRFPEVRALHHEKNRGYGAALRTGFAACRLDYYFYTDGDRQFRIEEIDKLLPFAADHDIVTGYRIERRDPFVRKLNANSWNLLSRMLLGIRITDINCAFKLYKASVFERIRPQADGAIINTEIFALARLHGMTIKEVGVHHYPRVAGTQTGANPLVVLKAFRELFALRRRIRKQLPAAGA
jgi:glycosyltransferase involved in cell wall biosynthesis